MVGEAGVIALALLAAQAGQALPWDNSSTLSPANQRPNPYDQFSAHYLVLRWGEGAPVLIRYSDLKRCEAAAFSVMLEGDSRVVSGGKPQPLPPAVAGINKPYAFCIPG